MNKNKIIPPLTDLSNSLALQALQNIGENEFTVWGTLSLARPATLNNFRILGHELQLAYQQGEAKALADAAKAKADNVSFIGAGKPRIERTKDKLILCFVDESRPAKLQRHYFGLGTPQQVEYMMQTQPVEPDAEIERLRTELKQVNEWRAAALAENQTLGELWASKVEKAEARVAELERFADNHPDTKLLDFLTSRASINFDDENCLLRFEVPSTFEGANNLREIIAAAKGEADRDDAEANGEADG